MKKSPLTLLVGLLLVVIFALLLVSYQVRTTQVAVVTTFGRPTVTRTNAGFYGKLPWPVQKVHYFDKRVQNYEDKFTEDFTADNNNLLTSVYIGWRITDPKAFFPKFANGSVAEAEKQLESLLRSSKSAVIGRHPLSDFVSASGDGSSFIAIENEILAAIRDQIRAHDYGLEIEFLGIKRLGLPDPVTQKVFDQMTAERGVLISAAQNGGEAEAQKIRSAADRRANEILAAAKGQALQIQGQGDLEASRYLAVFEQNPELANILFSLTALEDSLREHATLIFDENMPPFNVLKTAPANQNK
jgi:modulator of FtsH protease HflC